MQNQLSNTTRNLKYTLRCLAKSSDILGNAAGAQANAFTASVGASAQPQQESSDHADVVSGLCIRLALRF